MPLRWFSRLLPPRSSLPPQEPVVVLAAPGSVTPVQRLSPVLAAGSLLAVAFRPLPRAAAVTFNVTNTNPSGAGSLAQAVQLANANPGATITFNPGLSGTIALTGTLLITDSVTIQGPGPGALAVSGSNARRVFYISSTASLPFTATISGLTIRDGQAPVAQSGGGIRAAGASLILDDVAVISNTAATNRGGGVDFETIITNSASLTIRNSLITGNQSDRGGGLATFQTGGSVLIQNTQIVSNTAQSYGGGVFLYHTLAGATIEDSTIADNTAVSSNGGGVDFYKASGPAVVIRRTTISGNTAHSGAGILLYKVSAPLLIENTTISGNHALYLGGGVYSERSTTGAIQDSTIAGNTAANRGGGIAVLTQTMPITDSIIAGNTALGLAASSDLTGTFELRYDLVQITGTAAITNAGGNLFGLDPLLGPLADNGGPTQTRLPAANSPAVNAGDPAFAPPPTTDQRGRPRLAGRLDMGAVERQTDLFLPLTLR